MGQQLPKMVVCDGRRGGQAREEGEEEEVERAQTEADGPRRAHGDGVGDEVEVEVEAGRGSGGGDDSIYVGIYLACRECMCGRYLGCGADGHKVQWHRAVLD
jgi:hypothetical protein